MVIAMSGEAFAFEDCLLKHYIRSEVWLPRCRERLKTIRKLAKGNPRRLKYFTFCAVGALDVLLLDRARVIQKSETEEFDTVYFFDRDQEAVVETRKRIPGANGFPGDFVKIVLQADEGDDLTPLDSPIDLDNTREVRKAQNERAQLLAFIDAFPFDVINLDVEQYLFRPKEELPGNLVNALRRVFEWQKRDGKGTRGKQYNVNEFTLMFTTQVGPKNLSEAYLKYLRDTCLQQNLDAFEALREPYEKKSAGKNVENFFDDDFDGAFKLAVPKSLIELALECDWHVDGERGVEVFQFDRPAKDGPYCMLHMAMTVRRQSPERGKRAPGQQIPLAAQAEHQKTIQQLFEQEVAIVEKLVVGGTATKLKADLDNLFEHRKKYYPNPDI